MEKDTYKERFLSAVEGFWPYISAMEKERLTGFGEGIQFRTEWELKKRQEQEEKQKAI